MNSQYSKIAALNLEKSLSKFRGDDFFEHTNLQVNIAPFAYLFVEMVRYSMRNVPNMDCVQRRLAEFGRHVGERMVDVVYVREKPQKRDTRLYNSLMFLKSTFWKSIFGKEADELEQDGGDKNTYYLIEHEPVVNRFTRFVFDEKEAVPLNTAAFNCGIVEAFLTNTGYPCTVTVTWYKGTAYVIKFDPIVAARERQLEGK
ncbi:transport protein particle component, Bet3 [Opisthorchis viverrini]|uniref:Trafficking protein particle complex subunit 5 n=1 Tax=Opisthorchis viverrini TaxID=6198 RepID=A0A1S8WQ17_OPIVI|nr:transport protein particle component, Bet3 [Opisthorchis viverrini]